MATVNIEHNLTDYELEETLEKALKSVRLNIQRPDRKFSDPILEEIATGATRVFANQMNALVADITEVING